MSAFVAAMALVWLFAEGFILVLVRWGACCAGEVVAGRPAPPLAWDRFARLSAGVFVLIAIGLAFSGPLVEPALAGDFERELLFGLMWNALCATWVGLEGAIALYVLRIDRLLHGRRSAGPEFLWLLILWPAFGVLYNALAVASAFRQDFDDVQLARVLQFFLRFCGAGWIAFEVIVARSGVRVMRLLSRRGA